MLNERSGMKRGVQICLGIGRMCSVYVISRYAFLACGMILHLLCLVLHTFALTVGFHYLVITFCYIEVK